MRGRIIKESDRQGLIEHINSLPLESGQVYNWEISRNIKRRTIDQNRLYWLWLTCIQDETGNDKEALHEYFKKKHLDPETYEVFESEVKTYTTKHLTTGQFKDYLEWIQVDMAQEGIMLPDPEDQVWESFYETYKHRI